MVSVCRPGAGEAVGCLHNSAGSVVDAVALSSLRSVFLIGKPAGEMSVTLFVTRQLSRRASAADPER